DALAAMNRRWGAPEETLNNIDMLRDADCIAVVSGQQAGLFAGPLYTIYKALTAVKLAGCLRQRNTKAVPVFWIAAEDHDFAEVAMAEFLSRVCQLSHVEVSSTLHQEGQPVGHVVNDESIKTVVDELFDTLPNSEFSDDINALVLKAWQPGRGFVESFAVMMTSRLGKYGLIFLDPLDPDLKKLAAPLYSEAARRSSEIATAIEARSKQLEQDGYHAQVKATAHYFPPFL